MLSEILVARLIESENIENSNLIEILGNVKPTKSTSSTITSIIRGLFTKNKKLLSLLNNVSIELASGNGESVQLFKSFVKEFILWLENDGIILFEKYFTQISNPENPIECSSPEGSICFGNPILNCLNYIKFINESFLIIRNPFIVDKLSGLKERLGELIDKYHDFLEVKYLNNISFNDVKLFCETDKAASAVNNKSLAKVSSFFKIEQIVERTRNESIYMVEGEQKSHIELMLLNLSGQEYNSLVILSIPTNQDLPRSLMYPPFRINELSIVYVKSMNQIVLKSINFSSKHSSNSVIITSEDPRLLYSWYKKLESIFPLEESDSPVSQYFLINSPNKPDDLRMSGLGINVLSDSQHKQELKPNGNGITLRNTLFTNTNLPPRRKSNDSHVSQPNDDIKLANEDNDLLEISSSFLQPIKRPYLSKTRKLSNSSMSSIDSSEAIRTQYDRSLNIINEKLSQSNFEEVKNIDGEENYDPSLQYIKPIKRNVLSKTDLLDIEENLERPISSQAEIGFATPDPVKEDLIVQTEEKPDICNNHEFKYNHDFSSVPNLSRTDPKNELYQLSTGSAIDIGNFGKSHNPSFSVNHDLADMSVNESSDDIIKMETRLKQRRKSLFGLFKKASKPQSSDSGLLNSNTVECLLENPKVEKESSTQGSNSNHKGLVIDVNTTVDTDAPLSLRSDKSLSQTPSSALPSPFALPSSTSMYFFKQYKNGSSTTLSGQSQEQINHIPDEDDGLVIPQELKDIINDEKSIDFYISPSSPKAMKISRWKQKYGKWEMITTNENLFLKIVVNYDINKSWLIVFKEVYDKEYDEVIDQPLLLLEIHPVTTSIRQSSALDIQISAVNAICSEKLVIMIRCTSGSLSGTISTNLHNILGVLSQGTKNSRYASSASLSSSIMDMKDKHSNSSTSTSLNSSLNNDANKPQGQLPVTKSLFSISSEDITNANVLNNPDNTKLILLNQMTVRLQQQLESYSLISNPSSWKILSMCTLSIYMISDNFTNKNYYNLVLTNPLEDADDYNWLICEQEKFNRIERIGKAGLLIKATDDELFMIECRGKKEFKNLFEIF